MIIYASMSLWQPDMTQSIQTEIVNILNVMHNGQLKARSTSELHNQDRQKFLTIFTTPDGQMPWLDHILAGTLH